MQITIEDHDSHHYGKSAGFKFWIKFRDLGGEKTTFINFADFAAYLVAAGEFDGYCDSTDDGELWRYLDEEGRRCESYTFGEVISDFIMTGDFDKILLEFLQIKMVIEDLLLEEQEV